MYSLLLIKLGAAFLAGMVTGGLLALRYPAKGIGRMGPGGPRHEPVKTRASESGCHGIRVVQANRLTLVAILFAGGGAMAAPVVDHQVASPDQALRTYQERIVRQLTDLAEVADQTCIEAEAPGISQKGQFCLIRSFSAPHSLVYKPLNFVGDSFIKNNVILPFLKSDVEHVQHSANFTILEDNYKFFYKGTEDLNGRLLYAFAVKPRRKNAGLFKGKILVDPRTSCIIRAAGQVKSPSLWIKRIDFVQDYAMVGDFTLPVRTESVTQARIIGRVLVTIRHSAYEVRSIKQLDSGQATKIDVPTKAN